MGNYYNNDTLIEQANEITRLRAEVDGKEQRIIALRENRDALVKERDSLLIDISELRAELKTAKYDAELFDERAREYRTECERLRVAVNVAQAANNEQRITIAELQDQVDQYRALADSIDTHQCCRCGHFYTPEPGESEDCPKCGFDGYTQERERIK